MKFVYRLLEVKRILFEENKLCANFLRNWKKRTDKRMRFIKRKFKQQEKSQSDGINSEFKKFKELRYTLEIEYYFALEMIEPEIMECISIELFLKAKNNHNEWWKPRLDFFKSNKELFEKIRQTFQAFSKIFSLKDSEKEGFGIYLKSNSVLPTSLYDICVLKDITKFVGGEEGIKNSKRSFCVHLSDEDRIYQMYGLGYYFNHRTQKLSTYEIGRELENQENCKMMNIIDFIPRKCSKEEEIFINYNLAEKMIWNVEKSDWVFE